jgi:chromate reductase, NAD(P)H dehydrogenase (quinone)
MDVSPRIFIINGSASVNSANSLLIDHIRQALGNGFTVTVFNSLKSLPHFDPALSIENTPPTVVEFRHQVEAADGIIICTPEYVFSIPSGLKNAIEWCVSTTVFSGKPAGLVTASASGQKGHEELQLIMQTVMARFTTGTTLLIPAIRSRFDAEGNVKDDGTRDAIQRFVKAFVALVRGTAG